MLSAFNETEIQTELSRRQAGRMQNRFLKGPIPMTDIWAAARLPGQALALYLAIRHQSDLARTAEVTVATALLTQFGIDKDSKSRSLKSLSSAGLIKLKQQRGKSTRITLVHRSQTSVHATR